MKTYEPTAIFYHNSPPVVGGETTAFPCAICGKRNQHTILSVQVTRYNVGDISASEDHRALIKCNECGSTYSQLCTFYSYSFHREVLEPYRASLCLDFIDAAEIGIFPAGDEY